MDELEKSDLQSLIDYSLSFAEKLLVEHKEFYPFAVFLNLEKELVPLGVFDGDDRPTSKTVLDSLEDLLHQRRKKEALTAYAITYDAKVKNDDYPEGIDTIVIKIYHKTRAYHSCFYYPYTLNASKVILGASWRDN